jgi:hypothetical protein
VPNIFVRQHFQMTGKFVIEILVLSTTGEQSSNAGGKHSE